MTNKKRSKKHSISPIQGMRLLLLLGFSALLVLPLNADPVGVVLSGATGTDPIPADTLWFNGNPNGSYTWANQNNTMTNQVEYNEFNVTGDWDVQNVWSDDIFTNSPPSSTTATWMILSSNQNGTPGSVVASGDSPASLTPTGFTLDNTSGVPTYTEYMLEVSGLNVLLDPGTYFLAVYPDNTNDGYAGNDTTDGDGAVGTPAGNGTTYYSADGGSTFAVLDYPPCSAQAYLSCSTLGGTVSDTSAGVGGMDPSEVPEPSNVPAAIGGILLLGLLVKFRNSRSTV